MTKIQAKQIDGSSVQFSSQKDLSIERFREVAFETCRLAVFSAVAKAEMTIPESLSDEKKVIMHEAFELALSQAIEKGIFNNENKPQISPTTPVPHKNHSLSHD